MNTADDRARVVALWDRVHPTPDEWPGVTLLDGGPVPEGFSAWRVGDDDGIVTVLPTLLPSAPMDFRRRYFARVIANGSGECPLCGAVAGLSADPVRTPAAWHRLPLRLTVRHATDCPATFTEAERRHFDPRAMGRLA